MRKFFLTNGICQFKLDNIARDILQMKLVGIESSGPCQYVFISVLVHVNMFLSAFGTSVGIESS
jgi:hypothetical protein